MSENTVQIRQAKLEDVDRIESLFEDVFGQNRSTGSYQWLFHESPHQGVSVVAETDNKIVAHAGTITRMLDLRGKHHLMATSVDAMTHPDWQQRGINRLLSNRLIELNEKKGVAVYGGFSNENSTHTAIKDQGRQSLGPVPLLIRPLKLMSRPWRIFSGAAGGLESEAIVWPDGFDEFCIDVPNDGIGTLRDVEYLKWRYRRPGGVYQLVEHRDAGDLSSLGILGLRVKGGLKLGFVMELLSKSGKEEGRSNIIRALIAKARALDCDAVCAMGFRGSSARQAFTRKAFVPMLPRLVGEHIEFSVRALSATPEEDLLDSKAWFLTWGDTDLV